jgi:flagellar hook-associated protein 2
VSSGQISGLISGLDTKSLIDALVTARSRPIALLEARRSQKTAELAAWKSLETILVSLKIQSDRLADRGLWSGLAVDVSDDEHVAVDAGPSALPGSWDLFVERLAVAHQVESQTYVTRDDLVGQGTLVIGTSAGTREIEVAAGTTLAGLADLVNAADAGVQASIVRSEAAGVETFRLVLGASESGEANRFTADASGMAGGAAPAFTTSRTGDDAILRFGGEGGTELRSSTNLFEDVVDGVDVTVRAVHETGGATSVAVRRDVEGLEAAVGQFVESYNAMIEFANGQFRFDPDSGVRPALLGSGSLTTIVGGVRGRIFRPIAGTENAAFRTLLAVGLRAGADGKLALDAGDFRDALDEDFDAVANLFRANAASSDPAVEWLSAPADLDLAGRTVRVEITTAAARATLRGDLLDPGAGLVIDASNDSFRITVDGTLSEVLHVSHGTYADGAALAAAIAAAIDGSEELGALSVGVTFEPDTGTAGRLVLTSSRWGSKGTITLNDTASGFAAATGLSSVFDRRAEGVDVAGTVDGMEAKGEGRRLTVAEDAADLAGLVLQVSLAEGQVPAGVDLAFTEGIGRATGRALAALTDSASGALHRLSASIEGMLERYAKDIAAKQEQLEKRRARLEQQYARLESTLAELTGQGQFIAAQIQALRGSSSGSLSG